MKRAILLLALIWPSVGYESEARVYGMTDESCASFTKAAKAVNAAAAGKRYDEGAAIDNLTYVAWFTGFVSGMNAALRTNLLEGTDVHGALTWIERYCKEHPLDPYRTAAM